MASAKTMRAGSMKSKVVAAFSGAGLAIAGAVVPAVCAAQDLPMAKAQTPQEKAGEEKAHALWQSLFLNDLDALSSVITRKYIYASYPDDRAWHDNFRTALERSRKEAALVRDFASYRAVLQHFVASFDDAHLSAYFTTANQATRWPGFVVRYEGTRYRVMRSTLPDVAAGAEVESCDGAPINQWVDRLAPLMGGSPGRDTTRASVGQLMFLGMGNPLYAVPKTCRIGGRDVALQWMPVSHPAPSYIPAEPDRTGAPVTTLEDPSTSISDIGDDIAWVRMGTMIPTGKAQMDQFHSIIDGASALRDKRAVILDVRGNAGGTYNWFMAFLRAFYGQEYADYYARARLEISNVLLTPSDEVAAPSGSSLPAGFGTEGAPSDPPMEGRPGKPRQVKLANGAELTIVPAPIAGLRFPAKAPATLARAQVFVLTDYGCASACLSFVDEMKRFPGVVQIGTETHIDRRSGGWPVGYPLPSGLAVMRMGRMVRDNRARGENEAWAPDVRYDGDITDTPAVKTWVKSIVRENDRP